MYANEAGGIMLRSASGANHLNLSLLNLERALALPFLTPGICWRWRSKLFCVLNMTREQTSTIMDFLLDEHLSIICTTDELSQCTRILLPLTVMALDSQHHGDTIQFSRVVTHELISEADFWELALTPMTQEVTAKSKVTGICKRFTFSTGDPLGPIQKADPIPGRQVLQPPIHMSNDRTPHVQLDSVMKMVSFHGCF